MAVLIPNPEHDPEEIREVISTIIDVLTALASITINDIGTIEPYESMLLHARVRIHLILNILEARKTRCPVLTTVVNV